MTAVALPPWPVVDECYLSRRADHSCPQCDGSHEHVWRAWHEAPEAGWEAVAAREEKASGSRPKPVRCTRCGARKCDRPACMLRRHHAEDHLDY